MIRSAAAARGTILQGVPPRLQAGAGGQPGALVTTQVQYAVGPDSGLLVGLASGPSEYASRYAPA